MREFKKRSFFKFWWNSLRIGV